MSQYFPKSYEPFGGDINVKVDFNKVNGIDATNFVLKTKYEKSGSDFEDKINKIDKKIPDVNDLV